MGLWQPGDRILLSTDNASNTAVHDLNPANGENKSASLDYHNRTLHVESITPHSARLVAIRLY